MVGILFCKACGGHIPQEELQSGKARRKGADTICGSCMDETAVPVKPVPAVAPAKSPAKPEIVNRIELDKGSAEADLAGSGDGNENISEAAEQELIEELGLMDDGDFPEFLDNMEEEAHEIDDAPARRDRGGAAGARRGRNSARGSRRRAGSARGNAERPKGPKGKGRTEKPERGASTRDRRSKRQAGNSRRSTPAAPATSSSRTRASRRQEREPSNRASRRGASARGSTRKSNRASERDQDGYGSDRMSKRGGKVEGASNNNNMIIIGSVVGVLAVVLLIAVFAGGPTKGTKRRQPVGTSASALIQRAKQLESSGQKLKAADLYTQAADVYQNQGNESAAQQYAMKAYGLRKHSTLHLAR